MVKFTERLWRARATLVLMVGLLTLAGAVACRGEPAAPAAATTAPAQAAPTVAAAAPAATATTAPGPAATQPPTTGKRGGTLIIGKQADVCRMRIHDAGCQMTWEITAALFDSLVSVDPETLGPEPLLAESWETKDGGKSYTFNLRNGVKFHNGREVIADDVEFSLNRMMDPELASYWGRKLRELGGSVAVISDRVVTVSTTQPVAAMMTLLGHMNAAIVPGQEVRDEVLDLTKAEDWIGAGPFQVVEYLPDDRWVMRRFEDYWEPGKPLLDGLTWQIIPDESTRVAALRTGDIQMTFFENPQMLNVLANERNVATVNQLTTNYYQIQMYAKGPLADQRVRQALSVALDRDEIVELAAFGLASPTGPMSPGFAAATPLSELPYYGPDLDRARQLLDAAGYGGGFSVGVWVTDYIPATVAIAQVAREQWRQIGVDLKVEQREQATWLAESFSYPPVADMVVTWWAGYDFPTMALTNMSSAVLTGLYLADDQPELIALLSQSMTEGDPARAQQIYRDIERRWAELAIHMPVMSRNNFIAYRSDMVENVRVTSVDGYGTPIWKSVKDISLR